MSDGREEIDVVEDGGKMMERGNTQMKMCTVEPSNRRGMFACKIPIFKVLNCIVHYL